MANPTNPDPVEANKKQSSKSKRNWKSWILIRLFFLAFVTIAGLMMLSMSSKPPATIGLINGQLAECPDSPNCVSTQTKKNTAAMEPIVFKSSSGEIIEKIKSVIAASHPRAKLISENDHYLHYEFTSFLFRFVDDVEFLIDDESKRVHFRSASRVGHSDLGANRKRMQSIVDELNP